MNFKITEVNGDLFSCPSDVSMAHCVSADLRMGKGIAVKFRNQFGQIKKLQEQKVKPGGVAILKDKERFIYNLITKEKYFNKPTYQSMSSSLEAMKTHMEKNSVKKLAIPRIGCGLDGLVWKKVKDQIGEIFQDLEVEITVYNFVAPSSK